MGRRVLIVDDEETIRWALRELFIEHGYEARCACDADDAAAQLADRPYDFLITDLKMPGRSGIEVVREARRRNEALGVIVLTGYASLDTALEALRLGAWDYLTKPCDVHHLLERVEAFFRAQEEHPTRSARRPPLSEEDLQDFLSGRRTEVCLSEEAPTAERPEALLRALKAALYDLGLPARRAVEVLQGCVEALAAQERPVRCRIGAVKGHVVIAFSGALSARDAWRRAMKRVVDAFGLDVRRVGSDDPCALVISESL